MTQKGGAWWTYKKDGKRASKTGVGAPKMKRQNATLDAFSVDKLKEQSHKDYPYEKGRHNVTKKPRRAKSNPPPPKTSLLQDDAAHKSCQPVVSSTANLVKLILYGAYHLFAIMRGSLF